MIALHFGTIPMGRTGLTGPTGHAVARKNTFAQHDLTRGKPALQEIGAELDTQKFDFFFCETFCNPRAELMKLEAAFANKTPLPLIFASGGFTGARYQVESLDIKLRQLNAHGGIARVEAGLALIEAPIADLLGLFRFIAQNRAPARAKRATLDPNVRNGGIR